CSSSAVNCRKSAKTSAKPSSNSKRASTAVQTTTTIATPKRRKNAPPRPNASAAATPPAIPSPPAPPPATPSRKAKKFNLLQHMQIPKRCPKGSVFFRPQSVISGIPQFQSNVALPAAAKPRQSIAATVRLLDSDPKNARANGPALSQETQP